MRTVLERRNEKVNLQRHRSANGSSVMNSASLLPMLAAVACAFLGRHLITKADQIDVQSIRDSFRRPFRNNPLLDILPACVRCMGVFILVVGLLIVLAAITGLPKPD